MQMQTVSSKEGKSKTIINIKKKKKCIWVTPPSAKCMEI
jgi:hypothetical protein